MSGADGTPTLSMPTDTVHVTLESRQYNMFNLDLGEGVARRKMLVSAIVGGVWVTLMLIIGVPLMNAPWAYVVPPTLLVVFATKLDAGGRPNYASWLDRFRFLLRRRRPLIPPVGEPDRHLVAAWWANLVGPITDTPFEVGVRFLIIDPTTIKGASK